MAIEGYVRFEYFSKAVPPYYNKSIFPELLDDEKITVETPNLEMSYHQYFALFKKFLMSVGFDEKNVMQGACHLAFNESNREETMREVAEEYELIMSEQLPDIIADRKKQDEDWIKQTDESWEQRYWALYRKMHQLERNETVAKEMQHDWDNMSSDQLVYTEEELNAMCDKAASDEEKEKCQEYNLREAEYYNLREMDDSENSTEESLSEKIKRGYDYWGEDITNKDMWDQGMMKVSTSDPAKAWDGLIPGSPEARAAGCICPVLDNEEMPDDKKWIDVECPIHGRDK